MTNRDQPAAPVDGAADRVGRDPNPSPPTSLAPLGTGSLPDGRGETEPVSKRRPSRGCFRPGQSGNPRGRPKRARGLPGLVERALAEKVDAEENGRLLRITKLEAAVKQLVNRAANGDQRATQFVFALLHDDQGRPAPRAPERPAEADAIVVAELARRLLLSRRPE
jgi:uncharacterized protein DUF5681